MGQHGLDVYLTESRVIKHRNVTRELRFEGLQMGPGEVGSLRCSS